MAVLGKIRIPIYMRTGDSSPERQIGTVVYDPQDDAAAEARLWRPQLAAMLRKAADSIENPAPCDCDGPPEAGAG
ncbi:hypothetical protein [Streptomyces adelaidensis]|uniref:hypothetical protein n=1 Tax=Streptomyces adelaidensis TaxID=2796465 RepID=UPI0019057196|nr:hypothetical protein [Streptomyces adelaidensis]